MHCKNTAVVHFNNEDTSTGLVCCNRVSCAVTATASKYWYHTTSRLAHRQKTNFATAPSSQPCTRLLFLAFQTIYIKNRPCQVSQDTSLLLINAHVACNNYYNTQRRTGYISSYWCVVNTELATRALIGCCARARTHVKKCFWRRLFQ